MPVVLEDQCHREVPNIQLFYRPVRQMVYAILFNLHHHTFLADKQREQHNDKAADTSQYSQLCLANFARPSLDFSCFCTDGVGNGPSTAASTGSYVPPQPQSANGSSGSSNALIPEIKIREWVWTAANPYRHPEIVVAVPVGWPVPTVHRLWFGTSMGT